MSKKYESTEIEMPLNANERFLYQAVVRLDALCHMMSDLLEVVAKQNGLSTTTVNESYEEVIVEEEEKKPKKTVRKSTKK